MKGKILEFSMESHLFSIILLSQLPRNSRYVGPTPTDIKVKCRRHSLRHKVVGGHLYFSIIETPNWDKKPKAINRPRMQEVWTSRYGRNPFSYSPSWIDLFHPTKHVPLEKREFRNYEEVKYWFEQPRNLFVAAHISRCTKRRKMLIEIIQWILSIISDWEEQFFDGGKKQEDHQELTESIVLSEVIQEHLQKPHKIVQTWSIRPFPL